MLGGQVRRQARVMSSLGTCSIVLGVVKFAASARQLRVGQPVWSLPAREPQKSSRWSESASPRLFLIPHACPFTSAIMAFGKLYTNDVRLLQSELVKRVADLSDKQWPGQLVHSCSQGQQARRRDCQDRPINAVIPRELRAAQPLEQDPDIPGPGWLCSDRVHCHCRLL